MNSLSNVQVQPRKIQQASWKDYAIRFLFGGIVTAAVGLIGKAFGPVVAGLFLAFPAILPASLTLIADHENEQRAGVTALGAIVGSIGLAAFGLVIWILASRTVGWLALMSALVSWTAVSLLIWFLVADRIDASSLHGWKWARSDRG